MTKIIELKTNTIRTHLLIPSKLLECEAYLMPIKWPAYRFMTPLQATRHFLDVYEKKRTEYHAINIDIETATHYTSGIWNITERNGPMTSLWTARQRADELGLPYEAIMDFTFSFFYCRKSRGIQPLQLFPLEIDNPTWHAMLSEKYDDLLHYHIIRDLNDPIFRSENFIGLPGQFATRETLKSFAMQRCRSEAAGVARFYFERRQLTLEDIAEVIPEDRIENIMRDAEREAKDSLYENIPIIKLGFETTLQACMGLQPQGNPICTICPHIQQCEKLTQTYKAEASRIHGSDKLADSYTRVQNAERQRKYRAKKKLEKIRARINPMTEIHSNL